MLFDTWDIQIISGKAIEWIVGISPLLLALPISWLIQRLLQHLVTHVAKRVAHNLDIHLLKRCTRPARWLILGLTISITLTLTDLPEPLKANLWQLMEPVIIALAGWLGISVVHALADWAGTRFSWKEKQDNLSARRMATQLRVFKHIAVFFVTTLTVIGITMTIPSLHNLGLSLFASAGVAGLVIGMAARPALSNLIAGVQLALAQPIRIDDVVIVENEWGRIEEITSTFIVVVLWDQRRLVVPLSYFLEKPFQNWTHTSTELLGTVYFYLDYAVPLDAMRRELRNILESSDKWDGRISLIQVTDCKEDSLEIRALVSARDASSLWDLRCETREKLIDFLQKNHPECLPRTRADITITEDSGRKLAV